MDFRWVDLRKTVDHLFARMEVNLHLGRYSHLPKTSDLSLLAIAFLISNSFFLLSPSSLVGVGAGALVRTERATRADLGRVGADFSYVSNCFSLSCSRSQKKILEYSIS